jgi:hypothetical protein
MQAVKALAAVAIAAFLAVPLWAGQTADLGTPTGQVILTVRLADGSPIAFDRAMIEQAGWETIRTLTPFTEGEQEFSGISMSRLIEVTGAEGSVMDAVALNDYRVEIPVEHAERHQVFLALDRNGEPMRVRDKGPIWVIYPGEEVLAAPERFDRFMIWQLREVSFR